jgi:cell wall-associated NlpC family hydrolase
MKKAQSNILFCVKALFILISLTTITYGQNKKLDKIEMLYDQGNYKKALTKSAHLKSLPEYKNHPVPVLFYALSEYQLSKSHSRYSSANAVYDYEKFLKLDSTGKYFKAYANYIYDMQMGIADEIRILNSQGKTDQAHVKYNTYQRLFGNIAKFDELVIENTTSTSKPNSDISKSRKEIVELAKKQMGTPYLYGGITTKGFDCSGFTSYVFQNNGYSLPRTAQGQSERYEKVKLTAAEPGDLVFFGSSKTNISHVGIVVSEKGKPLEMIHASTSRGVIHGKVDADPYWSPRLQFVARVVNE